VTSGGATTLRAARVFTPLEVRGPGSLTFDPGSGTVLAAGSAPERLLEGERDLGDRIVVPGLVDVHTHGADGAQVNGDDPLSVCANVGRIATFHATHGTTSWLATTVTDSPERLIATVEGVVLAMRAGTGRATPARRPAGAGARVGGLHLEGPWIAKTRKGAQNLALIRDPDLAELDDLLAAGQGAVKLITLAPELPRAFDLLARARDAGVGVSIGHSDADFETAGRALDSGAGHVTHLFNAMAPLHHRRPGVLGAALSRKNVTLEVIADLEHVHPAVIGIVASLAPGRMVAVTDSVPAAGLGAGLHHLAGRAVRSTGRRVELAEDPATLAGSLLTMDVALRNLVQAVGMPLEPAVTAATLTPARAAGLDAGTLRPGGRADFAVLDPDLRLVATVVAGDPVHDPEGLFS
jgi:N-acetylglucosamine-6-phosphate deacetylase